MHSYISDENVFTQGTKRGNALLSHVFFCHRQPVTVIDGKLINLARKRVLKEDEYAQTILVDCVCSGVAYWLEKTYTNARGPWLTSAISKRFSGRLTRQSGKLYNKTSEMLIDWDALDRVPYM